MEASRSSVGKILTGCEEGTMSVEKVEPDEIHCRGTDDAVDRCQKWLSYSRFSCAWK